MMVTKDVLFWLGGEGEGGVDKWEMEKGVQEERTAWTVGTRLETTWHVQYVWETAGGQSGRR